MINDCKSAVAFYHSLLRFGVQPGLDRIAALCAHLGHPERKMRYVHVAGTNGKGTVCTEISNVLRVAGFRTGLYTSPYVIDFRERIQINNAMISETDLTAVTRITEAAVLALNAQGIYPTEFEAITAAAFLYFADQGCDVVVLETGLGGRYDATNIIDSPIVSVITSISLDHTAVLGDTVEKIAYEKAGIIKHHCHCVLSEGQQQKAVSVIRDTAAQSGSYLFAAEQQELFNVVRMGLEGSDIEYRGERIHVPFAGVHQLHNAAAAIKACEVIGVSGLDITKKHIKQGIEASFIPARTEIINGSPLIILDGSHNDDSTKALADLLEMYAKNKRVIAVMGMMKDKDIQSVIDNLGTYFSHVIAVTPSNPRAIPANELQKMLQQNGVDACSISDPKKGIDAAVAMLSKFDMMIVCGSLYLAGDVRSYLMHKVKDIN